MFGFIVGALAICILFPLALEYVVNGRYGRVAFLRQQRVANRLIKSARQVMSTLYYYISKGEAEVLMQSGGYSRVFITWMFFVVGLLVAVATATVLFIFAVLNIYFRAMVLWRGLSVKMPYGDTMGASVHEIAHSFLPDNVVGVAISNAVQTSFEPIQTAFEYLSTVSIDLTSIGYLHCNGASAPFELMIFLFIMGLFVVLIESNYQLFRGITFMGFSEKYAHVLSLPAYRSWAYRENGTREQKTTLGYYRYLVSTVLAVLARALGGVDIIQPILLYTVSLVKVTKFADYKLMHTYTPACNHFMGFENYDFYLSFITSMLAWSLIVPATYELSKVLIPGIPAHMQKMSTDGLNYVREPRKSWLHVLKYSSLFAPDLYLALFSTMWVNTVKHNTPTGLSAYSPSVAEEDKKLLDMLSGKDKASTKAKNRKPKKASADDEDSDSGSEGSSTFSSPEGLDMRSPSPAKKMHLGKEDKDELDPYDNVVDDGGGHHHRRGTALMYRDEAGKVQVLAGQDSFVYTDVAVRVVSTGTHARSTSALGRIYISKPGSAVRGWSTCSGLKVVEDAYYLVKVNRVSGRVDFAQSYDVKGYGRETAGRKIEHLVDDLNEATTDHIVVVFTTGEPAENRMNEGLPDALYRCGASPKVFSSSKFEFNSAYTLIGIPSCGAGNGFELNQGGGKHAVIDVTFDISPDGWKMAEVHVDEVDDYCFLSNKSFLLLALQQRAHRETFYWKQVQAVNMPSYYILLKMEFAELREMETSLPCCSWGVITYVMSAINLVLVTIGLGHLLTSTGRRAWYLVWWKLLRFISLAAGYWTDDVVHMLGVHELMHQMSVVWDKPFKKKSKEAYHDYRYNVQQEININARERALESVEESMVDNGSFWRSVQGESGKKKTLPLTNDEAWLGQESGDAVRAAGSGKSRNKTSNLSPKASMKRPNGLFAGEVDPRLVTGESDEAAVLQHEDLKRKLRQDYAEMIRIMIATRATVLQVIPQLSLLTVFAINVSGAPLSIHSERLKQNMPAAVVWHPFSECRRQENEMCHELNWIRKTEISLNQDCRPNPRTRIIGGQEEEVPRAERALIEQSNNASRKHMQEVINQMPRHPERWIIAVDGTIKFFTESRYLVFVSGFLQFGVTLALVLLPSYPGNDDILRVVLVIMGVVLISSAIMSGMKVMLMLGRTLHITDEDIAWASGYRIVTTITDALRLTATEAPDRARVATIPSAPSSTDSKRSSTGHTSGESDDDNDGAVFEDVNVAALTSPPSAPGSGGGGRKPVQPLQLSYANAMMGSDLDDILDDTSLTSAAIGSVDSRAPGNRLRLLPSLPPAARAATSKQSVTATLDGRDDDEFVPAPKSAPPKKLASLGGTAHDDEYLPAPAPPSRALGRWNMLRQSVALPAIGTAPRMADVVLENSTPLSMADRVKSRRELLSGEGSRGASTNASVDASREMANIYGASAPSVTSQGVNPLRELPRPALSSSSPASTPAAPAATSTLSTLQQIRARREASPMYQALQSRSAGSGSPTQSVAAQIQQQKQQREQQESGAGADDAPVSAAPVSPRLAEILSRARLAKGEQGGRL